MTEHRIYPLNRSEPVVVRGMDISRVKIEDSKGALLNLVSDLRDRVESLETEVNSLRAESHAGRNIAPRG